MTPAASVQRARQLLPSGQSLLANVLVSRGEVPHFGVLLACLGKRVAARSLPHRPALFLIPRGSGAGRDSEQMARSHGVFLRKFLGLPRPWGLTSKAGFWGSLGGGAPEGVLGVCLTDQTGALTTLGGHREGGLGAPDVSTHKLGREGAIQRWWERR